jgi:hypothetical protein
MAMPRPVRLTATQQRLKAATALLLAERASLDAAALETGLDSAQLAACQAPGSSCFLPVDVLAQLLVLYREEAPLHEATEAPALLAELARCAGFTLVPMQQGRGDELLAGLAEWSGEIAQTQAVVAEVLVQGNVRASDAARLEAETLGMIEDGRQLVGRMRALFRDATSRQRPGP